MINYQHCIKQRKREIAEVFKQPRTETKADTTMIMHPIRMAALQLKWVPSNLEENHALLNLLVATLERLKRSTSVIYII